MKTIERIKELAIIMITEWINMIIMLILIDRQVVPITLPGIGYMKILLEAVVKILLSGAIALGWLYLWRSLVKIYIKKLSGD